MVGMREQDSGCGVDDRRFDIRSGDAEGPSSSAIHTGAPAGAAISPRSAVPLNSHHKAMSWPARWSALASRSTYDSIPPSLLLTDVTSAMRTAFQDQAR